MSDAPQSFPTPWRVQHDNAPIADTGDYDCLTRIFAANGEEVAEAWNPEDAQVEAFELIVQTMNSAVETPAEHYTVAEAWRIATTLAHNICTQESDRINADDGPPEAMHALTVVATRIRGWLEPGDQLTGLLAEGTGRAPSVKTPDVVRHTVSKEPQ
jgi:hypothetical protein